MSPPLITMYVVQGRDYFVALLSNGSVRVGLVGAAMYDLPPRHSLHARALAARTEADAERLHDRQSVAVVVSIDAPRPSPPTPRAPSMFRTSAARRAFEAAQANLRG